MQFHIHFCHLGPAKLKSCKRKIWYLGVHLLFGVNSICRCEDVIQEYKHITFQVKGKVGTEGITGNRDDYWKLAAWPAGPHQILGHLVPASAPSQ